MANPELVHSLTVHVTCKFTAVEPSIHLRFSRFGLTGLVGPRESLYSVLEIHKATNFQTDLDHHCIQLHLSLTDVLVKLNLLRLHVDSPHVHIQIPYKHPVSGAIVACQLNHSQFQKALLQRARSYIYHIKDLGDNLIVQLGLRIKQVHRFERIVPHDICPKDLFNEEALATLFQKMHRCFPLMVPTFPMD